MVNISSFIQFHALRTPDKPALIYQDQHISYAELLDRVVRLAGFLIAQQVKADQVVAVVMKNSAAFLELAFAVSHIGAVFLPVNFRLARDEIQYILDHADATLVFADEEFRSSVEGLKPTVFLTTAAQRDTRTVSGSATKASVVPRAPENLYRLLYTSGTTSRPKGAMHTYANWYWKCWDHITALGIGAHDRLLVVGPLYHVGAFDCGGMAILIMGGAVSILGDFDAEAALAAIEADRLTCTWMAPVMLGRVLTCEQRHRYDVSSLSWCVGGGEKTPESRIRLFSELFKNGRYVDAYGLSESCGGDTLMEAGMEITKIGSAGRAVAHVEIRICDDQGNTIPAGTDGEICLRGPKIMRGYWRDEERTRQSFFGDWFRTGDVGHLDQEGFLYLTDRIKDMIKSGGENIASSEVERVILQLPQVADAAVVGVPDEQWGERLVAAIELLPGTVLDFDTLARHCRMYLAGFKVPKELVIVGMLPRNPSGKVLKRILRNELQNSRSRA